MHLTGIMRVGSCPYLLRARLQQIVAAWGLVRAWPDQADEQEKPHGKIMDGSMEMANDHTGSPKRALHMAGPLGKPGCCEDRIPLEALLRPLNRSHSSGLACSPASVPIW